MLITRYGEFKSAKGRETLDYMQQRFAKALSSSKIANISPHFTVLDTREPFAYSAGAAEVVISKGLVASLANEAELSFVLAHELAHEILGHNGAMHDSSILDELPISALRHERKELELEADRYALGIMAVAGYDPRASTGALVNSYRALKIPPKSDTHPELEARIQMVYFAVNSSGWEPPGTIDRRSFRQFKREILN